MSVRVAVMIHPILTHTNRQLTVTLQVNEVRRIVKILRIQGLAMYVSK